MSTILNPIDFKDRPALDAMVRFETRADGKDYAVFVQRGSMNDTPRRIDLIKKGDPHRYEVIREGYEAWKAGHEIPEHGTPIMGWSGVSQGQAQLLLNSGYATIEQLAQITDGDCQKIMGGIKMRDRARAWLDEKNNPSKLVEQVTEQADTIEALKSQIEDLQKAQNTKRGPGRPKKTTEKDAE